MFADFSVDATLDGAAVVGIFDANSQSGLDGAILGSNPVFMLDSASAAAARGKVLVVGAASYTVREVKPDGTGMAVLELEAP